MIKSGDVVTLNSGGPHLTVINVWNIFGWKLARCIGYNGERKFLLRRFCFKRYLLPVNVLRKVTANIPKMCVDINNVTQ